MCQQPWHGVWCVRVATMHRPRMRDFDMPFDGKRMMWGGFETIFQS